MSHSYNWRTMKPRAVNLILAVVYVLSGVVVCFDLFFWRP